MENLHDATSSERMTQLIVLSAGVRHSSGDTYALKPGVVDILLGFEAEFLHNVDFDFIAPGDTPGAAVLGGVLRARCTGAGAGAVDCIIFHGFPILSFVVNGDAELYWVSASTLP